MEARLARVESAIEQVQTDVSTMKNDICELRNHAREVFRILFGALIVSSLGLAAMLVKGFHWI